MVLDALKKWATSLKNNVYALYLASKDARVPKLVKIIIGIIVAYALSPIDLIPDFIPVIGYLDDLILLPIGIWLVIRLIPQEIWRECQSLAKNQVAELSNNPQVVVIISIVWIIVIACFILWLWPLIY